MPPKQRANIRQMEIDDVSSVYRLGEKLFTSEEFPTLYRTWDPYEVTGHFTSDPYYCLVAEVQGTMIGFLLATTFEKEGTAWKKYGYVTWLAIEEEYQGTHIGTRLYRELEKRWRGDGVRMAIVETGSDNVEGIGFFTATGFSPIAEHLWLGKVIRRSPTRKSSPKDG